MGHARALADLVKEIDPNILVLSGGAHSSGDWANAIIDSPVDLIVVNEADQSFVAVLDAVTSRDMPVQELYGIAYRQGFTPVRTDLRGGAGKSKYITLNPKKQTLAQRQDLMPLPNFGFISLKDYEQPYHSSGARVRPHGAWAQIFSTIGCNVNCDFCYIPMVNGPWRALGADWFDLHLADIKKHGVTEVLIEDDHLMHESGCYNVYLAVESANEESLENSNKPRMNTFQQATRELVSIFADHKIQVTGGPIPGTRTWEFQREYVVRNYDTGWSHEKATMATHKWSAEDMERMRLKLLVEANGLENVKKMLTRGTWPVDNPHEPN